MDVQINDDFPPVKILDLGLDRFSSSNSELEHRNGVTFKVKLAVNGINLSAVVDSGAQLTVLRRDLAQKCQIDVGKCRACSLQGAFESDSKCGYIADNVLISVGKLRATTSIIIADISDEILLGGDFIHRYQCILDLEHCQFGNKDSVVPLEIYSVPLYGGMTPVTLQRTVKIAPHSALPVVIRASGGDGNLLYVEPASNLPDDLGLIEALVCVGSETSVCLTNTGDKWLTVASNTVIGVSSPVTEYCDLKDIMTELDDHSPAVEGVDAFKIQTARVLSPNEEIPVPEHLLEMFKEGADTLSSDEKPLWANLLVEFQDVFAKDDYDLGLCNKFVHHIDTGDSQPIRQRMRRTPLGFAEEEEKSLKQMLQYGIIQPSQSQWASAPVLIRKKDGSVRYCIDYRALNACTKKDAFPLPRIEECLDMLGPFVKSKSGNVYVLMIIDQFTKWVECLAVPDQTAKTVCQILVDQFFSRFGLPLYIHSDQGRNFESNLFQEICKLLDIVKTRTTPYRPASNGQVERSNRTVLQTIRSYLKGEDTNWDKFLPIISMAIRGTANRNTGYTPNYLMFGRELSLPDELFGISQLNQPEQDLPEYIQTLRSHLKRAHEVTRTNIGHAQRRQKRVYDRKLFTRTFEPGDSVYKLNTQIRVGQTTKFKPIYNGPYLVTKVISPVLYRIESQKKTLVMHHDRLRPCPSSDIPIWLRRRRQKLFEKEYGNQLDESAEIIVPDDTEATMDNSVDIVPSDFDVTVPYRDPELVSDVNHETSLSKNSQSRSGRTRKTPGYLTDYVI